MKIHPIHQFPSLFNKEKINLIEENRKVSDVVVDSLEISLACQKALNESRKFLDVNENLNLYFAYGSNMSLRQMKERAGKDYSPVRGILKGYALVFNKVNIAISGAGFANVEPKENSQVEGLVYELNKEELEIIDKYEGVKSGHYYRAELNIEFQSGETKKCAVYLACPGKIRNGLKPSRKYLETILEAKDYLSPEYFQKLSKTPVIG